MSLFRLSASAVARLESVGEYTQQQWGMAQRDKYLEALDRCFHNLARAPLMGRARDEVREGLRSFQEGKHVVFYIIDEKDILIIDIVHERSDVLSHQDTWN